MRASRWIGIGVLLGVASAAAWTWRAGTWPGPQPAAVGAWRPDLKAAAWRDVRLPADSPAVRDYWELHRLLTIGGHARITIDWPSLGEGARPFVGRPFDPPLATSGRTVGEITADAASAAGWPGDLGFAWVPTTPRGGERLVLTRRPADRPMTAYISIARLQRRTWAPRAHWRGWIDGKPLATRRADRDARVDRHLRAELADRLRPSGALPGNAVRMLVIRWSGPDRFDLGLELRGSPAQLAAADDVVRRMEWEGLIVDLSLGGLGGGGLGTAALGLAVGWQRLFPARRRRRLGLCPACGYDLRGGHIACPECGRPVPATA